MGAESDRLKIVRANYAAFSNGDIDGIMEPMSDDVEIIAADEHGVIDPDQHFAGGPAARAFFEEIKSVVALSWVEIEKLTESDNAVVAEVSIHGRIRATEREGVIPAVHRLTFRGEEIVRIETFRPNWRKSLG